MKGKTDATEVEEAITTLNENWKSTLTTREKQACRLVGADCLRRGYNQYSRWESEVKADALFEINEKARGIQRRLKTMKETKFELREEHLKLLRSMYVGWDDCEFGAPEIDPKRPYGNSDVLRDILELFGLEEIKKDGGVFKFNIFGKEYLLKGEDKYSIDLDGEAEVSDILNKLHKETEIALQIVLKTGQFKSGIYKKEDEYGIKWEYDSPIPPTDKIRGYPR